MSSEFSTPSLPNDQEMVYCVHVFCCINRRPETHRRGCCCSKSSESLANYMCRRSMAKARGNSIRINLSGCLNMCEYGPAMVIYPEGIWYRYESESDIEEIFDKHVLRGEHVTRLLIKPDMSKLHR